MADGINGNYYRLNDAIIRQTERLNNANQNKAVNDKQKTETSSKVLSQRLKDLEARGVLSRTIQPTSPPSVEYALTPLGEGLVPALEAIVAVGHRLKAAHAADRA